MNISTLLFVAQYIVLTGTLSYSLWIFYLAVMNLKRARDEGTLPTVSKWLGFPVLVVGYVLDFLMNVLVMSVLLVEIPQETTVTSRLKRHKNTGTWRSKVSLWFAVHVLDPFDPSGRHI